MLRILIRGAPCGAASGLYKEATSFEYRTATSRHFDDPDTGDSNAAG